MLRLPAFAPAALLLLTALAVPADAGRTTTLSAETPTAHWHGTLSTPAPMGCGGPNLGCDTLDLVVQAAKGTWITVSIDDPNANLRITNDGRLVGSGGDSLEANARGTQTPTTTFQQVATGRTTYAVSVGDVATTAANPVDYTGTAKLAGKAFDRAGECGVTSGLERLGDSVDGRTHPLAVRLVADPKDAAPVRQAGRTIVETYARIGVPVVVSYDFRILPPYTSVPYDGVRSAYGGVRPPGIDVVHVMTDDFAGGIADCIGGVAYPEKAFSVGNVHYTVQGTAAVSQVPAGMVAAHEIGHLLGAQHQQYNCAEAAQQQADQPASDGWVGPCTLMSPTALNASETFSTLERNTIRYFVTKYAGKG